MGRMPAGRQAFDAAFTSSNNDETFLLYCPDHIGENDLLEAVHALYYLPLNFKLLVVNGKLAQKIQKIMAWTDKKIIDRIQFTKPTGLSQSKETSPFFYADAVVYNDETGGDYDKVSTPHVTVSRKTRNDIESDQHHGYRVQADCPEALATAVLKIARATV